MSHEDESGYYPCCGWSRSAGHRPSAPCGGGDPRPTNPANRRADHHGTPAENSGISGTWIEEWEDPIPVEEPRLPAFPIERLGALAAFVRHAAAALQVAPDLIAFACLAVIAIATGGRKVVEVKPGWRETLALYLAAVADSSEKKTPALNLAAQPLREAESELVEAKRPEIEKLAQEIRITQARMANAEKKAASDKPGDAEAEADAARMRLLQLGPVPNLPRLLVRDATLEAVSRVMAAQGGRIGLLASEGGLLKVAAGLYGNSGQANTDLLLEAYSGTPYTVDRSNGTSFHMPWTFLAIGLVVQPGVLAGLEKHNPQFRENGLLGRFLYAMPAPTMDDRFDAPEIPAEIYSEYDRRIRSLLHRVWPMEQPSTLRLSPNARDLFREYYDQFGQRRKPGGDLYDIADWAGKLRGQLIRIAACLTLYEDPGADEISGPTMADVLAMAPYLIDHARAAFDLMADEKSGRKKALRDLLAWLRAREKPDADFSAREAWQALKGRKWATSMDEMNAALDELEECGWIALKPTLDAPKRRGRKASPRYEVHPWVYKPPSPAQTRERGR